MKIGEKILENRLEVADSVEEIDRWLTKQSLKREGIDEHQWCCLLSDSELVDQMWNEKEMKSKAVLSLGSDFGFSAWPPCFQLSALSFQARTEKGAKDRTLRHTFSNGGNIAHRRWKLILGGEKEIRY